MPPIIYNLRYIPQNSGGGEFGKLNIIHIYFTQLKIFDSVSDKSFMVPRIAMALLNFFQAKKRSLICWI